MKINKIIYDTNCGVWLGADPSAYEIILSYDDYCSFLDLAHDAPFRNIVEVQYMAFKDWFDLECQYSADVKCLYDRRLAAVEQIDQRDQYRTAANQIEAALKNEQELIRITVEREALVMAFLQRWAGQQTDG